MGGGAAKRGERNENTGNGVRNGGELMEKKKNGEGVGVATTGECSEEFP